jgi:hypothetical protein
MLLRSWLCSCISILVQCVDRCVIYTEDGMTTSNWKPSFLCNHLPSSDDYNRLFSAPLILEYCGLSSTQFVDAAHMLLKHPQHLCFQFSQLLLKFVDSPLLEVIHYCSSESRPHWISPSTCHKCCWCTCVFAVTKLEHSHSAQICVLLMRTCSFCTDLNSVS